MDQPLAILAIADTANPLEEEGDLQHLDEERAKVEQALWIKAAVARTFDQLETNFRELRNTPIFHFSGHANAKAIKVEMDTGRSSPVYVSGFSNMINLLKNQWQTRGRLPKLVFLNGCNTRAHLTAYQALAVPIIITTNQAVRDSAARMFACAFYEALFPKGSSRHSDVSVRRAFEYAVEKYHALYAGQQGLYETRGLKTTANQAATAACPYEIFYQTPEYQEFTASDICGLGMAEKTRKYQEAPTFYYECDRQRQYDQFKVKTGRRTMAKSHVFIIPGCNQSRHQSLIRRFNQFISREFGRPPIHHSMPEPWVGEVNDLDYFVPKETFRLFELDQEVEGEKGRTAYPIFRRLPAGTVAFIDTEIQLSRFGLDNRATAGKLLGFIDRYVRSFWNVPVDEQVKGRLVYIFIKVVLREDAEMGSRILWNPLSLFQSRKNFQAKFLEELRSRFNEWEQTLPAGEMAHWTLFDDLQDVSYPDLIDLFERYEVPFRTDDFLKNTFPPDNSWKMGAIEDYLVEWEKREGIIG